MGSILGKILDIHLLNTHGHILETKDLQFGFKRNHSAGQCTFAMKEVIKYYNNKKNNVHVMLLDDSQAFDRVNYAVFSEHSWNVVSVLLCAGYFYTCISTKSCVLSGQILFLNISV